MDQSPAAFFCAADETDDGHRGATGFRGFGDFSVDFLLLTVYGGGGENFLPTCVLCHVSRCTTFFQKAPGFSPANFEFFTRPERTLTTFGLERYVCLKTWSNSTSIGS